MPATLSTYVPDEWEYTAALAVRLQGKPYNGKPGPYLRDLVEADLSGVHPISKYTAVEVERWKTSEALLVGAAAELALKVLQSPKVEDRLAAAAELAETILRNSFRQLTASPTHSGPGGDAVESMKQAVAKKNRELEQGKQQPRGGSSKSPHSAR